MKQLFPLSFVLCLVLTGCSQIKVEGMVVFDDGTPLTAGKIVFDDTKHTYTAKIQANGSWRIGTLKDGSGIPAGHYRVGIAEAFEEDFSNPDKPPVITHLIADKFRSSATSGYEFDIQKTTKNIVITVEKP